MCEHVKEFPGVGELVDRIPHAATVAGGRGMAWFGGAFLTRDSLNAGVRAENAACAAWNTVESGDYVIPNFR